MRDRRVDLDTRVAAEFLEQIDGSGTHVDLTLGAGFIHANGMRWQVGCRDSIYIDVALRMAIPVSAETKE